MLFRRKHGRFRWGLNCVFQRTRASPGGWHAGMVRLGKGRRQGQHAFRPEHMVFRPKTGLVGQYMNNCGCNGHQFEGAMINTIMEGSVKAVVNMGWEGLKLDSCSQFNNLSWWNELINATGHPVLLENCHQGGFAPGMVQWQGYIRNASVVGGYVHRKGYFSAGHDAVPPIANTTFSSCKAMCDQISATASVSRTRTQNL